MNVCRSVVAIGALLLATQARSAQFDLPPGTGGALIVLSDGSQVHVGSYGSIEATARAIEGDRAAGRMELRGDVRIKVMHDGFEAVTIATSSAVITRVAPEKARWRT